MPVSKQLRDVIAQKKYFDLQNLYWYYESTSKLYPQLNLAYLDKSNDNQFFNFETDKKVDGKKFIPFCEYKRCSTTMGGKCIIKGINIQSKHLSGSFAIS